MGRFSRVAKMAIFMNFPKFDDPSISYRFKNHLWFVRSKKRLYQGKKKTSYCRTGKIFELDKKISDAFIVSLVVKSLHDRESPRYHSVRRCGTACRGTVVLVICLRTRSYRKISFLSSWVGKRYPLASAKHVVFTWSRFFYVWKVINEKLLVMFIVLEIQLFRIILFIK